LKKKKKLLSKSLSKTELERDLGVYVSKDLNWQYHINYMVNKANRVLGSIKHTFSYLDANSIKLLFTSLVRPHLEYAAPIWNPNSSGIGKSQQIENIQRRATRTQDLKRFSYQDRLYLLNLPSLENRRSRGDLIKFFKIMNGINDVEWHNPPRLMSLNRESRFHNKRIERELTKVRSIRYEHVNGIHYLKKY
jgi:ribonucleases P/MRP protein subunit RPP40